MTDRIWQLLEEGTPVPTAEEAWLLLEKDVLQVVRSHSHLHGGQLDDLIGEAHEHFMGAYVSWDPSRGPLGPWVLRLVRLELMEVARRKAIKQRLQPKEVARCAAIQRRWDITKFLRDLGEDASQAVRIALEMPERPTWNRLVGQLLELGWAGQRVLAAMREIKEALL